MRGHWLSKRYDISTLLHVIDAKHNYQTISSYVLDEPDLSSYQLSDGEWDALNVCKTILLVRQYTLHEQPLIFLQVPHSFQQRLSMEKTPTLCHAIPSFQAMQILWNQQKRTIPFAASTIDAGLEKLAHYEGLMSKVPAYVIATSRFYFILIVFN